MSSCEEHCIRLKGIQVSGYCFGPRVKTQLQWNGASRAEGTGIMHTPRSNSRYKMLWTPPVSMPTAYPPGAVTVRVAGCASQVMDEIGAANWRVMRDESMAESKEMLFDVRVI